MGKLPATMPVTKVVLGVTGSIAAYKAAEICSLLRKAGVEVRVAMTACGARFVTPLTFETLTQQPVYAEVFGQPKSYEMDHISWAKWADAFVVAPATANIIAKLAHGLADDPVSTFYLSFDGPTVLAPAMNTRMLSHPATEANLATLRARGVAIVAPAEGLLACGDVGRGKLADPVAIVTAVLGSSSGARPRAEPAAPDSASPSTVTTSRPTDGSLVGRTVLITSGPTHEYLDPVRFLTNPSSGRMGAALTLEARRRGATVHLVSGPVSAQMLPSGEGITVHRVTTAEQMLRAVRDLAPTVDVFVFAAAVSDFRVAQPPTHKIKRSGNSLTLPLVENPDIAQAIGCIKEPGQITVGFAAETEDLERNALMKLERKRLDLIVANNVSNPRIGFDRDVNEVTIFGRDGSRRHISERPKSEVAYEVFESVLGLLTPRSPAPSATV